MGLFGIKTRKDKEHEEKLKRIEIDSQERIRKAEQESKERLARISQEGKEKLEQQSLEAESRESDANRRSAEKKIKMKVDADVRMRESEDKTQIELAKIEQTQKTRRTEIAETEETRRNQIAMEKEVAIAEKEREFRMKGIEATEKMFCEYLNVFSEMHRVDVEALIKINENRKEKFFAELDSARNRQARLDELSKEAKGQEKLNYLNESREIEEKIQKFETEDFEADKDFAAKLKLISEESKKEISQQKAKPIDAQTLFLDSSEGEEE